jgi:hypothetical protein
MKIIKKAIFIMVFLASAFSLFTFNSLPVRADESLAQGQVGWTDLGLVFGVQPGGERDVRMVAVQIVNVALTLLAALLLILLVIAGFKYMLSGGNESKAKDALAQIKNAIIGLVIVLAAWVIARYVVVMTDKIMQNKVDYTTYQVY